MAKQKTKTTIRKRVKKGSTKGKIPCNICHGTGFQNAPHSKKK